MAVDVRIFERELDELTDQLDLLAQAATSSKVTSKRRPAGGSRDS